MSDHIPVHHLFPEMQGAISVDRILPCATPVVNDVHRHDFHELFLFTKGNGEHMIDLEVVLFDAPCIHVVLPGQVHQLSRSADCEGAVLMFGSEMLDGSVAGPTSGSALIEATGTAFRVENEQRNDAAQLIQAIEHESTKKEAQLMAVTQGYLGILLLKCATWSTTSSAPADISNNVKDPARRFVKLVDRNFLDQRSVAFYADQLAITADHLSQLVKKRSGSTASALIQERLMLEAKRLLLHSHLSIKEVGYALNMKDPAYFSRWFGKVESMTPAAYREHIRDKYKP